MIHLCGVPISNIAAIDRAAEQAPIHNQYPGYNCQDYVLELLDDLEGRNLINGRDANYQRQKALVIGKQEGLQ